MNPLLISPLVVIGTLLGLEPSALNQAGPANWGMVVTALFPAGGIFWIKALNDLPALTMAARRIPTCARSI